MDGKRLRVLLKRKAARGSYAVVYGGQWKGKAGQVGRKMDALKINQGDCFENFHYGNPEPCSIKIRVRTSEGNERFRGPNAARASSSEKGPKRKGDAT